jgi:hypothetical protein
MTSPLFDFELDMAAFDLQSPPQGISLFWRQHGEQFHFLYDFAFVVDCPSGAFFEAAHESPPETFADDCVYEHQEEEDYICQDV